MTNTFWVAANIMFDLETGKKTEILLLATREGDATYFTSVEADTYLAFVQRRATNITWFKDPHESAHGQVCSPGRANCLTRYVVA